MALSQWDICAQGFSWQGLGEWVKKSLRPHTHGYHLAQWRGIEGSAWLAPRQQLGHGLGLGFWKALGGLSPEDDRWRRQLLLPWWQVGEHLRCWAGDWKGSGMQHCLGPQAAPTEAGLREMEHREAGCIPWWVRGQRPQAFLCLPSWFFEVPVFPKREKFQISWKEAREIDEELQGQSFPASIQDTLCLFPRKVLFLQEWGFKRQILHQGISSFSLKGKESKIEG